MNDIVIRLVEKKDLNKIVSLRKNFVRPEDPVRHVNDIHYYSWHNFENPIQGGSFFAAYCGEKAVGMFSIVPKRISIYNERFLIGETCDAFIHPDFQGRKIWSRLYKINHENAESKDINLLYASSPTEGSYPIFIHRFNYTQLSSMKLAHLIRPLDFKSITRLKLGSHLVSNMLSSLLKLPFNLVFKSYNRKENFPGLEIQEETHIPSQYQEFWQTREELYDLYFVRDPEYIHWRYFLASEPYEFFSINLNGTMIGYYVLKTIPWRNLKIGALVDYFFNGKEESVYKFMINHAISRFSSRNVDLIQTYCLSSSPFYKRFIKYGFLPYRKDHIIFFNTAPFSELKNRKINAHYTMGDSDYI